VLTLSSPGVLDAGQRAILSTARATSPLGASAETDESALPAPTDAGLGSVVEACGTGWSALCAMEVPALALGEIAAMIAGSDEVKHACERAFDLKHWFVATGSNERRIRCVLYDIRYRTQLQVIALPLGERARSIRTSSRKQRGSRRRTADRGFRRRVAGVAAVLILARRGHRAGRDTALDHEAAGADATRRRRALAPPGSPPPT
jgi:hypothetical protein